MFPGLHRQRLFDSYLVFCTVNAFYFKSTFVMYMYGQELTPIPFILEI